MNVRHRDNIEVHGIPQSVWVIILTIWIGAICGTICTAICAVRNLNVTVEFKTPPVSITQNGGVE